MYKPGEGYGTEVKPLGDCDDGNEAIHPETIWYVDSDNDGYRDPDGESRVQCDTPTDGNWTISTTIDSCPDSPYNGNNGCDPNCALTLPSDTLLEFGASGGTQQINYTVQSGCSGYGITFGNLPSWVTAVPGNTVGSGTITVTVGAHTEFREHTGIAIYSNGSIQGGFAVKQNGDDPEPPGPDPCTATDIADISFGAIGGSSTVTVSYSGECTGTVVLRSPIDANGTPDWLTIVKNGLTFTLTVPSNTNGVARTTVLSPMLDDGNGNYTGMGIYFSVSQASCLTKWYPDSDGDGHGDIYGAPEIGCTAPDLGNGITWVSNNNDLCPYDPAPNYANGCPNGIAPENWNTVTTTVYDVSGTVKGASKGYFDELGRPVQSQSLDVKSQRVWASAALYDKQGRPALNTLSAPIRDGYSFVYKNGFIDDGDNNVGTDYDSDNFETNPEEPDAVGTAQNTLGHYYSELNVDQEGDEYTGKHYQDKTDRPYSRSIYSTLNPGTVLKTVGGNKINGQWPQSYGFSMAASTELSTEAAFGDAATEYDGYTITKTVVRDVHGNETVIFIDTDGMALASARSGGATARDHSIAIGKQGFVDIHVPKGNAMGFTVNSSNVTVYDLIAETTVTPSISLPNGFYRVVVSDPSTYTANSIVVSYRENYYDYALSFYDEAGRMVKSTQPLGKDLETTYEYNTLGQLIKTVNPDEGTGEIKYREDGQIRFSQNSAQQSIGEFSYTNYDHLGRPIESGVALGAFANLDPDTENFSASSKKEQQFTQYDVLDDGDLTSLPTGYGFPTFLSGNVAKTWNDQGTTYYSYDIYGRVQWVVQDITGLGTKTMDYTYNPISGLVDRVSYQKGQSDQFIHRYTYDEIDQLTKVETSTDDSTWILQAEYGYYETGGLKRTEIAGGAQGVDYVYNLAGQLKTINHPDLSSANDPGGDGNDLFGMQLDYYTGDYQRNRTNISTSPYGKDQLNGNIKGVRWQTKGVDAPSQYVYNYDERTNWITGADFNPGDGNGDIQPTLNLSGDITGDQVASQSIEVTNGTLLPGAHLYIQSEGGVGDYDVSSIAYDANGNITGLTRKKNTENGSNAMDDLDYHYKMGTNQLVRVNDTDGDVEGADDIGDQLGDGAGINYKYNAIGQLIEDWEYVTQEELTAYLNNGTVPESIIYYTYNTQGLVTEVKRGDNTLVKFFYNDWGHRIRKETYVVDSGFQYSTYYVRDIVGTVVAVYSNIGGSMALVEQPMYGQNRIGVAYNNANNSKNYIYELTDHLGNVRVLFSKNTDDSTVLEGHTDYFPFGMQMPGRRMADATQYRYAFQGQEKDQETGKEAFQLRLWDGRIGRWLSTDPYGQYHSPYLGMGNNPIGLVDVDGGFADPPNDHEYGDGFVWTDSDGSWQWNANDGVWQGLDGADDIFGFTQVLDEVYLGSFAQWKEEFIVAPNREQWDFVNEMIQRDHIRSIHAATAEAAELVSIILPIPGGGSIKGAKAIQNANKMRRISKMGKMAEKAVAKAEGIAKKYSQVRIDSRTGTATYRVADFLTPFAIHEVKNVSRLRLTNQMRDFMIHAMEENIHFVIHTRKSTKLSPQMQKLKDNGIFIHKIIGK